jgi:hypothetical protein
VLRQPRPTADAPTCIDTTAGLLVLTT